jgi:predicted nucleic acid-binding protein
MAAVTKNFILDTSVIVARLLEEDVSNPEIRHSLDLFYLKKIKFISPPIIVTEVGNALKSACLSDRITPGQAHDLLKHFLNLPIKLNNPDPQKILKLSISKQISFYDASYLALSEKLGLPLLTLDKKLASVYSHHHQM